MNQVGVEEAISETAKLAKRLLADEKRADATAATLRRTLQQYEQDAKRCSNI